jgi:hypothetical protein
VKLPPCWLPDPAGDLPASLEQMSQQGATEKKMKKNNQCTYVLYLARIELLYTYDDVIFFIAFLSSPYRETPKNAIKKVGAGKKN